MGVVLFTFAEIFAVETHYKANAFQMFSTVRAVSTVNFRYVEGYSGRQFLFVYLNCKFSVALKAVQFC